MLAKPFLAKKQVEKIHLTSSDDELKEFFDEDCLLPCHGGTSEVNIN